MASISNDPNGKKRIGFEAPDGRRMGNSKPVAAEHYLQVTDAHFAKAVGDAKEATQNATRAQGESGAVEGILASGENGNHAENTGNEAFACSVNARDRNRTCTPFGTGT